MIGAIVVISARLTYVQALDPDNLADQARKERLRTITLTAARGNILDNDGQPLARTIKRYIVTASPEAVKSYRRIEVNEKGQRVRSDEKVGARGAAEDLAPVLGIPEDELYKKLSNLGDDPNQENQYVRLAKEVSPETWRKVEELRIPQVNREVLLRRNYPAGALAGNVIGFLSKDEDSTALAGLERAFDERLRGQDGKREFEAGGRGHRIWTAFQKETKPVPGRDVQTTLDRDIQWYAQDIARSTVLAAEAEWGTIIVQDPKTFNVLAMAEYPVVDPTKVAATDPKDRGNRCVSAVFEPGSTTKIITAAMALEEGNATPETQFVVPYKYRTANNREIRDSSFHKPLNRTTTGIIAESSNTGTVMLAEKSSLQTRFDYLKKFGVNEPTGLGLPGESKGILRHYDKWDGHTQHAVTFGQGYATNPMQVTAMYSMIANNGLKLPSTIVTNPAPGHTDSTATTAGVGSLTGTLTKSNSPSKTVEHKPQGEQIVSVQTAQSVQKMLESVVAEGTGENARIPGYRVAGKTGTAQIIRKGQEKIEYTSSFIGFAPANDPQVVVSVIVHKPQNGHYGGTVAAPAFRQVMTYALGSLRVPPSLEEPDLYPIDWK